MKKMRWKPWALGACLKRSNIKAWSPAPKESLVIAADQVLEFEGQAYGKAADIDEARKRLQDFNGNPIFSIPPIVYSCGC